MERNDLEVYLKRLQELDKELDDDSDPSEFMKELNDVLNGLSQDIQLDTVKKSTSVALKFVNTSTNPDPSFAHEGDSGFDIRSYIINEGEIRVPPGQIRIIPTGLYFEVDKGLEVQIRSRSGLASKSHIMVLNSPGTIDSHYRGEIKIILANLGNEKFGDSTFVIQNGDRIAQGVVCPVYGEGKLDLVKVEELSITTRNASGFGSTGVE